MKITVSHPRYALWLGVGVFPKVSAVDIYLPLLVLTFKWKGK